MYTSANIAGTSYINNGSFVVGNTVANASAKIQVDSTTQGFLPPRMSGTQRTSIVSPSQGLMVYDTTIPNDGLYYYNSGSTIGWHKVITNNGPQIINGGLTATTITAINPTKNQYICDIGLASDQTITTSVDTLIDFIDVVDDYDWYDPSGRTFRPNIEGYYHIDFNVWFDASTVSTGQYNIQLRKNGNTVAIIQQPTINNGTGQSLTCSKLVYLNGTTDYLDFTAYQSTGVNRRLQVGASSSGTYATIFLLAI
jgi:hypothetical protein